VPVVATAGAVAYLAVALWMPVAFPALCALLVWAAGAVALTRRPSTRLRVAVTVAGGVVLAVGFGALWLADEPVRGFAWLVVGGFVAPLPILPWLYAASSSQGEE